jgi:peptide/nickel transport system substrate-binding protein
MAAVLQQQWRAIGIDVEIKVLERALFEQRRRGHQFDLLGINSLRLEPDQILVPYFHSGQIPFPNVSSYRGADALIEGAREQLDPKKRREFYEAAQRKIQADAPIVALLYPNIMYAWRSDVQGAKPGLLVYNLEDITIQRR